MAISRAGWILTATIIFVFLGVENCRCDNSNAPRGLLLLQGKVLDSAGNPLSDANVIIFFDGKPFMQAFQGGTAHKGLTTAQNGLFRIEIPSPSDKIRDGKWSLKITRPSFKTSPLIPLSKIHQQGPGDKV